MAASSRLAQAAGTDRTTALPVRLGKVQQAAADRSAAQPRRCFHCGEPCPAESHRKDGESFCCVGCLSVYSLLSDHGLESFYELGSTPGVQMGQRRAQRWEYLDAPGVQGKLLDYA